MRYRTLGLSLVSVLTVAGLASPTQATEYQADTVAAVSAINSGLPNLAGWMKSWNGKLYVSSGELYEFDGTSTVLVQDYNPSGNSLPGIDDAVEFNGKLYFEASNGTTGSELTVFDPTANPPMSPVADIFAGSTGSNPRELTVFNGSLYFVARSGSNLDYELWKYTGTGSPTRVMDLNPGAGNSVMGDLTVLGNRLYFSATDGTREQLWSIDAADNLRQETSFASAPDISSSALFNGKFYFGATVSSDDELYVYDPSSQTTTRVANINLTGSSYPNGLVVFQNKLVFSADDGTNGFQLFSLDADEVVTRVSSSLIGDPSSFDYPYNFRVFGNKLYFAGVSRASPNREYELWAFEGFGEPYEVFGFGDGAELVPAYFAEYNSKLYFSGYDNPYTTRLAYSITQGAPIAIGLSYSNATLALSVGQAIAPQSPVITGASVDTFSVSPGLPTGLTLNTTTGTIAGTPTTAGSTTVTITSTALNGQTDTFDMTINITGPCQPGSYSQSGLTPCLQAAPGYFVANAGATQQTLCPAGMTSGAGATSCYVIPQYTGPVISTVSPNPAASGESLTVTGLRLDGISSFEIDGKSAPASCSVDKCSFLVPDGVGSGEQDLVAVGDFGKLTVQGGLSILGAESALTTSAVTTWTRRISDTQAKIYAKGLLGAGKVQFFLNGREVAWVRAVDETDPKLRTANGDPYLVRTVTLQPGQKNAIEIFVDGERLRRVAYSRH